MKFLIISILLCLASLMFLTSCTGKTPDNVGIRNGRLANCPDRNNCVSSQATDDNHKVQPLRASGKPEVVMVDLSNTIEFMFGGKLVEIHDNYLRAEFTTRIFRFVDDLECYYDEGNGIIHVRSASRIGYSDLNTNRNRVEELRQRFKEVRQ